jgi:hypothetical protein
MLTGCSRDQLAALDLFNTLTRSRNRDDALLCRSLVAAGGVARIASLLKVASVRVAAARALDTISALDVTSVGAIIAGGAVLWLRILAATRSMDASARNILRRVGVIATEPLDVTRLLAMTQSKDKDEVHFALLSLNEAAQSEGQRDAIVSTGGILLIARFIGESRDAASIVRQLAEHGRHRASLEAGGVVGALLKALASPTSDLDDVLHCLGHLASNNRGVQDAITSTPGALEALVLQLHRGSSFARIALRALGVGNPDATEAIHRAGGGEALLTESFSDPQARAAPRRDKKAL